MLTKAHLLFYLALVCLLDLDLGKQRVPFQFCNSTYHTTQGDTCPTKWYISLYPTVIPRIYLCVLTSSNWLKADFWIHGLVAADTSHSERLLFVGLPMCIFLLSTNQNLFKACTSSWNDCWTCIPSLDKAISIALHSVHIPSDHTQCKIITFQHQFSISHFRLFRTLLEVLEIPLFQRVLNSQKKLT